MATQIICDLDAKAINGINVTALFETIDAIKNDHILTAFRFRSNNHWPEGGHNLSTIQSSYGCRSEDTIMQQTIYIGRG